VEKKGQQQSPLSAIPANMAGMRDVSAQRTLYATEAQAKRGETCRKILLADRIRPE